MFPDRFPPDVVSAHKAILGLDGSAGQLQQRPAPKGGLIFKRGFVRHYRRGSLPEFWRKLLTCDTAFSEKKTADFSVIGAFGECKVPGLQGLWGVDLWRDQVGFPQLKVEARRMGVKHRPEAFLIEKKASGQSLIQELARETNLPVVPVEVDKDKVARAAAGAATWEAGRIWLPELEDEPWVGTFLEELYAFPRGKNDDQVDILTQLIKYAIIGDGDETTGILDFYRSQAEALKGRQS